MVQATLRVSLLALLATRVDAHGSGVWRDPGHYVSDTSLAGLRFVAEFPAHTLTMVGTDDGSRWWMLKGTCSGPGMTQISFDFSPKKGPANLTGTWSMVDGIETITWPDGNAWTGSMPTPAFQTTTAMTFHGLFLDSAHYVPNTFAGVRILAETPQHTLHLVGSDDGTSWWYLKGNCHGTVDATGKFTFISRDYFRVDFSPKGGPADLVASWDHKTLIKFPDGNTWFKPDRAKPSAKLHLTDAPPHVNRLLNPAVAVVLAVATLALANAVRRGRPLRREQPMSMSLL